MLLFRDVKVGIFF